jgi:hypothetical protein
MTSLTARLNQPVRLSAARTSDCEGDRTFSGVTELSRTIHIDRSGKLLFGVANVAQGQADPCI